MPTLILLCGLPGSGKTTLARALESERPALRLTPDEWMVPLFGAGIHADRGRLDACRDPVEAVQWEVAARALRLGVDVVLDWGFWLRRERDEFRSRAAALGARTVVRLLDVPLDELRARLIRRNAETAPGTFRIEERDLAQWWSRFERPTPDELDGTL